MLERPGASGSSPYAGDQVPVLRPSIVCYADSLGYESRSRQALLDGQGDEFLQRVHGALSRAHERIRAHARQFEGGEDLFALAVITGNIVVGYPSGRMHGTRTAGGHWRVSPTEIERLLGAASEMSGEAVAHSLAQALAHLTAAEAGAADAELRRLSHRAVLATQRAAEHAARLDA